MMIELRSKYLGKKPGDTLNVKRRQGEALVMSGAAEEVGVKKKKRVPEKKALKKPPADRMVKSADVVNR